MRRKNEWVINYGSVVVFNEFFIFEFKIMSTWKIAKMMSLGEKVEQTQFTKLKQKLGLHPSRLIRFADRSETEELITFEVKNSFLDSCMFSAEKVKALEKTPYLMVVSIAPDEIPEYLVIDLNEKMDEVTGEWL